MELYISAEGHDDNPGTPAHPVRTLERAKELVRDIPEGEAATVFIRGGRYFFEHTVRFTAEDRGNVSYRAYGDEPVYFDGGLVIPPDRATRTTDSAVLDRIIDQTARAHIMEIDLKPYGLQYGQYGTRGFRRASIPAPNELFIDTVPQQIARYPNDRYLPLYHVIDRGSQPMYGDFSMRGAAIGYLIERGDRWGQADDAYLSGFPGRAYADDTLKIKSIDTVNRMISTELPTLFGFVAGGECKWRIVNLLEEIDAPGEYFLDRARDMLYLYPPWDISGSLIQLSVMAVPFLSFMGASDIAVSGITFENARGSGIYIERGGHIAVEDCLFRNLGTVAVQVGQGFSPLPEGRHDGHGRYDSACSPSGPVSEEIGSWHEYLYECPAFDGEGGTNHIISGCEIRDMGSGGIMLGGGNRRKLAAAGNMVYNCRIHRVNRLDLTYKAAVNIWGVGNIIRHCELDDLEGFAVYLHGNDHLIEYTKVHNAAKSISDGAAIYMGRDPSEVGNIIRHNFIYDIKNPHSYDMYGFTAIYFDDHAIYNEVYGNYFYDIVQKGPFFFSTIHWNCGGMTSVANNIFIDCHPGPDPNSYDNAYDKMHTDPLFSRRVAAKDETDLRGVDVESDIWRRRYPYLYDTYVHNYNHTTVYYNNFVCSGQYHNFADENPSHLNFKLRKDSYLHGKYASNVTDRVRGLEKRKVPFEDIDFDRIGLCGNRSN
ncbi:MAG: parallel beta-helix repeat protein [Paenibacillaceae bacterium]|jgi:hypothetical protein|nr:parallel beta-helix repeat protein [Paenibacillaceae bacterium]